MLISDLAFQDMERQTDDLLRRCGNLVRRMCGLERASAADPAPSAAADSRPGLHIVPAPSGQATMGRSQVANGPDDEFRWRRHPQLRRLDAGQRFNGGSDQLRAARAAATRGMFLARSARFDEARWAFGQAAAHPDLDLSATTGFWDLTRAGMLSAVLAYEDADRIRDAAALGARIRIRFRPAAITALPTAEAMARVGRNRRAVGGG